ncbi:MAG TPA: alpha/beta hydrolase [Myxococcota bacterium]|nr:alpha/beta hydrolase [Myxococcota bacterium]
MLAEQTLRIHGAELHVETDGAGEPLLLLHGMGGCSQDWRHAGRESLAREYRLVALDARGHGRSTNPQGGFSHRQLAADVRAALDALGIARCRAIGLSMGGNTLLHVATQEPERIEAMVVVSATPYFPEQARAIMRTVSPDGRSAEEWRVMRERHAHGDAQIRALWQAQHDLADSTDDMCFTPPQLARIRARTLVIYGDRDPLYPVELGVGLFRAIPRASLWVVPGGGHGPVFLEAAEPFARTALAFLHG